jgi:uncharacterized membrane protein HdeD (DUF308 family)
VGFFFSSRPETASGRFSFPKRRIKKAVWFSVRIEKEVHSMQTKSFRWNLTGWSLIAFYAICGLLLLLWPDLALTIANYALAAVLCVVGLAMIIGYIRSEAVEGMLSYGLAIGLILALVGVVLFIKSGILITLLPFLWGIAMIAGGFGKFQMAFDLKRIHQNRWWLLLIGALISFVLGIFSVTDPVFLATVATQFAGISLLVEAVLDTSALLMIKNEFKHLRVQSGVR